MKNAGKRKDSGEMDKDRSRGFLNEALCARCGGRCCKVLPGITSPADWEDPLEESLLAGLVSERYSVDWWEGEKDSSKTYFVRPSTTNSRGVYDPSWGGVCVFLGDQGCELELARRPWACRMLEPVDEDTCVSHAGGKKEGATAWLGLQGLIVKVADEAERIRNGR